MNCYDLAMTQDYRELESLTQFGVNYMVQAESGREIVMSGALTIRSTLIEEILCIRVGIVLLI